MSKAHKKSVVIGLMALEIAEPLKTCQIQVVTPREPSWCPPEWCNSPGPPRLLSQLVRRISGDWLRLVLQEGGRSVSLVRVLPQPDEPCPKPMVRT